jgi:predicted MFS family arabinose efflux permease
MSTVSSNTVAIDIIPSTRRAEGVGYFGMNMNLAMAIAPFVAMYIYERPEGFHLLIFCSIIMGTFALIAASLIKTPVKEKQKHKPPLSVDRFILIKGIPLFLNQILVTTGWGMLIAFGVLYGNQIQISNAGIFFLFLAAGLIISRVISGRFVDRGHIHVISILALSLITISFLCFASFHTITAFCVSAFFVGIGYGMMLPSFQTSFINMAASDRRGTANSTYLTAFDLGLGIGMLLGGFIAGAHPMAYIYLVSSGLAFCSVIMYIFVSRKVYDRNKLNHPSLSSAYDFNRR